MAQCKLTAFQLIARKQYRKYVGKVVVGGAGFPWVLADVVPSTKFWIVWALSVISGNAGGSGLTLGAQITLLQAGSVPPRNAAGTTGDDPFFLNYNAFPNREYGPGLYGLRVDRYHLTTEWDSFANRRGDEANMIRRPFLVGPGECLLAQQCQYGTPANPGASVEMRMAISIIDQSEEIPLGFL
jgi:hypothetical protein